MSKENDFAADKEDNKFFGLFLCILNRKKEVEEEQKRLEKEGNVWEIRQRKFEEKQKELEPLAFVSVEDDFIRIKDGLWYFYPISEYKEKDYSKYAYSWKLLHEFYEKQESSEESQLNSQLTTPGASQESFCGKNSPDSGYVDEEKALAALALEAAMAIRPNSPKEKPNDKTNVEPDRKNQEQMPLYLPSLPPPPTSVKMPPPPVLMQFPPPASSSQHIPLPLLRNPPPFPPDPIPPPTFRNIFRNMVPPWIPQEEFVHGYNRYIPGANKYYWRRQN